MQNTLFFICPTDFLETKLNQAFTGDNYFLTALGNNYHFDNHTLACINHLVESNYITQLIFVSDFKNKRFVSAAQFGKNYDLRNHENCGLNGVFNQKPYLLDNDTQLMLLAAEHLSTQVLRLKQVFKKAQIKSLYNLKIRALIFNSTYTTFIPTDDFLMFYQTKCLN